MTIQQAMQSVEDVMAQAVNSDIPVLRDASHHILAAGGKRVRPRLLLLAYEALGGTDVAYAVPVAAAVELVHTASVVHDDINDHGVVRRGRPSVNALWGRTFALLTGDFLFTKVYELMGPYRDFNIVLAEATVALVEGETLQAAAVKERRFTRDVYYDIIARKTAALFKACGILAARLAGADDASAEALGRYGFNIGLAFQMIDDVLDLTGDEVALGKTSGIDFQQGRGYAQAFATTNGGASAPVAVAEPIASDEPDVLKSIKAKMLQGDAVVEARAQAMRLAEMAVASIAFLPESNAKQGLVELANLVVNRTS